MRLPDQWAEAQLHALVRDLHALASEWEGHAHPDKAAGLRDAVAQLREVLAQHGYREPPVPRNPPPPWYPRRG